MWSGILRSHAVASTGATSVTTSALGGTIHVRSTRGAGTAITGGLPARALERVA